MQKEVRGQPHHDDFRILMKNDNFVVTLGSTLSYLGFCNDYHINELQVLIMYCFLSKETVKNHHRSVST